MDLLCLECSLGELDGLRYRDAAFCVWASVKNNKTLWGMNQIVTDRDTKAHMLIHSVNFTTSLLLLLSYIQPTSLSFSVTFKLTFILIAWQGLPAIMCYSYAGQFSLFTLAKLLVSAYCHVRFQKSGLASAFQRNVTVCISICLQVLYVWWASTRRGMNWPTKKVPSLPCFQFSSFSAFWFPLCHSTPAWELHRASSHRGSATIEVLTKCILSLPDSQS